MNVNDDYSIYVWVFENTQYSKHIDRFGFRLLEGYRSKPRNLNGKRWRLPDPDGMLRSSQQGTIIRTSVHWEREYGLVRVMVGRNSGRAWWWGRGGNWAESR